MTVPHDRVSYGSHAFPFRGFHADDADRPPLPLLPIKVRNVGGAWSRPVNAVLDTGSTRTIISTDVAAAAGLQPGPEVLRMRVFGSEAPVRAARLDAAIVDAQFPDVSCWQISDIEGLVPVEEGALEFPLLGWDLLHLFDIQLSADRGRIEMRLARRGTRPPRGI